MHLLKSGPINAVSKESKLNRQYPLRSNNRWVGSTRFTGRRFASAHRSIVPAHL